MIKYLVILCLLIAATLYTLGGRTDAPVRDGLAGKLPPLVYQDPEESGGRPADLAVVQQTAAPAPPKADPAPAPASAASAAAPQAAPSGSSVISAAFATAEATSVAGSDMQAAQSLTLALPLVDAAAPGAAASDPVVEPATAADAAPTLQYVVANTVNVRTGPSAETESLTKLNRGEAVLVLPSDTPGWSMIRIEGDGLEGYIATRFLGEAPSDGIFTPVN
jgi:hypothetical protein